MHHEKRRFKSMIIPPNSNTTKTSWTSVLLEKPPVLQLLMNYPKFYETQEFSTYRAFHWSLA
jgi:hypothetical protein